MCATYLINRMPLSSLGNISPYERLYGTPPLNNHLRAFGCLCFASTIKQGRKKFDAKADPCVFIGYPFAQKAYKVYNLKTKKIFTSRDITFHEHLFPYHLNPQQLTTPLPFYLPSHHPLPTDYITFSTPHIFPYPTRTPTLLPTHNSNHPTPIPNTSAPLLPTLILLLLIPLSRPHAVPKEPPNPLPIYNSMCVILLLLILAPLLLSPPPTKLQAKILRGFMLCVLNWMLSMPTTLGT